MHVWIAETRYRSLCELCYDSNSCSAGDKYWGRQGPLYCLSSGNGDVTWARLDDVKIHFGVGAIFIICFKICIHFTQINTQ